MSSNLSSHWWWDLSTREFSELNMSDVVAIQPIAAVEQHGPHLPVRVDAAINAGIVARAVELMEPELNVLVLPMLPVGKSNEHLAYPGTLSLSYDTLARVWYEVGESVHRAGCRKIIFFNSHGGQPQVMEIVARELRVRLGMLAIATSWFNSVDLASAFDARELRHGIHGGEIETSVMLHLHPGLTNMAHAADFPPLSLQMEQENTHLMPDGPVSFGWQSQDLHPSGVSGNAALADAQRGQDCVEAAARALVGVAREALAFPLERLDNKTAFQS